jgi:recombination protein RecR
LALNTDVESDATVGYVAEALKGKNVAVTRLASGLPAGSGIRYSDSITLSRAVKGRRPV